MLEETKSADGLCYNSTITKQLISLNLSNFTDSNSTNKTIKSLFNYTDGYVDVNANGDCTIKKTNYILIYCNMMLQFKSLILLCSTMLKNNCFNEDLVFLKQIANCAFNNLTNINENIKGTSFIILYRTLQSDKFIDSNLKLTKTIVVDVGFKYIDDENKYIQENSLTILLNISRSEMF